MTLGDIIMVKRIFLLTCLLCLVTLVCISWSEAYADYSFTFTSNDGTYGVEGTLNTPSNGNGPFIVSGGSVTGTGTANSGVTYSLVPTSPSGSIRPFGATDLIFDNQLSPGSDPVLDRLGLVFESADGLSYINIWGNSPGSYTLFQLGLDTLTNTEIYGPAPYGTITIYPTITPEVLVPQVVGMPQTDAENAITAAGLTVGAWDSQYSSTVTINYIISQDPPAGTAVPVGSSVTLTTSLGPQPVNPQPVTVPNIVGMTQAAAQSAITSAGLTVGTTTQAYSATVPSGDVISQDPASGSSVATGSAVNLTVSMGPVPPVVTLVSLVGQTQSAAQSLITLEGLTVGTITQAHSSTFAPGYVISQSPTAGTKVYKGSSVNLTVSMWLVPPVTVPNVVGMTQSDAQTAITGAGLTIGTTTQAYSATVPPGDVISQNPASGSSVATGSAVNLTVSMGPVPLVTVPNVVGMTQSDAQTAITGAGLTIGYTTQAYSATVPPGDVISQNPASGSSVATGSAVNLTVSYGTVPPVKLVNLVGQTQSAAQSLITLEGLTVGTITQVHSSTFASGYVISQSPAAGTTVPKGSSVNLTVSIGK